MLSVITGVAKKGQVGEAVAAALSKRGDTVLLIAREAKDAADRARDVAAAGGRAFGYGCDLSQPDEVAALAERIGREHGGELDAVVHLAGGFASLGPIGASDPRAFDHQLRINLATAYLATRAFFSMVARSRGSFVFVASESVLEGAATSGVAAYAAAKAGVVALMRSVADEGRPLGVRANALAPGAIRTATNEAAMGAAFSYVEREDVASVIAFLCSRAGAAITGQVIRLRK